jgi:LPS-assembly protein
MSVRHSIVRRIRLASESDGRERFLTPRANEIGGRVGIGNDNRRGWNGAFDAIYNFVARQMVHATTQVTYNTECCGFSVQYRRLGFRNDNWYGFSFTVANIGAVGTLKRQERLF